MTNKTDNVFEPNNSEIDDLRAGFTIDAIDELIKKTARPDEQTKKIDFSNDDLWLKDIGDGDDIEIDLEKYRENYLETETAIHKKQETPEYISPFGSERSGVVLLKDRDKPKKTELNKDKSAEVSTKSNEIKKNKYAHSLLDVMNPDNDLLMGKTKSSTYDMKPTEFSEKLTEVSDRIDEEIKINEPKEEVVVKDNLADEKVEKASATKIYKPQIVSELDFEEENATELEPLKSHVEDIINKEDVAVDKSSRFINQPTIKTAHLDVINEPEKFERSESKFIKKPDDYVNPFEKKDFNFTDFDDEDDFETFSENEIEPPVLDVKQDDKPEEKIVLETISDFEEELDLELETQKEAQTKHVNTKSVQEILEKDKFDFAEYDDNEDEVEKINENEAEKELLKRRKHKVNQFKLKNEACSVIDKNIERFKTSNKTKPNNKSKHEQKDSKQFGLNSIKSTLHNLIFSGVKSEKDDFKEYNGKAQNADIRLFIGTKRASLFINIGLLIILTFFLLLLAIGVQVGNLPEFINPLINPKTLIGSNLVLVLLSAIVSKSEIINGIKNIQKRRFGKDGVLTITVILAILQNIFLFTNKEFAFSTFTSSYSCIAIFGLLFNAISNYLKYTRIGHNFSFLNSRRSNYCVSMMEDEKHILAFSKGAEIADTNLAYSSKVDFCTDFMRSSNSKSSVDKIYASILPIIWVATAVIFIITLAVQNSFDKALAGALAISCVTSPISVIVADNFFLNKLSKKLRRYNSMISGIDAIEKFSKTNAIVIDAKDLFPKGTTEVCGMKIFNDMRIDEAILYTSSILSVTNAPLASAFEDLIDMKESLISGIESVTYEGHLGISAWIDARRVLVGTREMMEHHNIVMPVATIEKKYLQNDPSRRILYLAVDSKISALFTVSYNASIELIDHLTELEYNATTILVRTVDANIDEKLISDFFEVSENCIKILSPIPGEIYKANYGNDKKLAKSFLMHKGKTKSFLYLINLCEKLKETLRLLSILQWLSIGIGFLLVSFFSIFTGMEQTGVLQILIYQLFWLVVTIIISSNND